jgi:hypothetical protein
MGTEALTILFLLAICLILGVSLVIVIQDLFKLEKRMQTSEEENSSFRNALQQEADIVLTEANKRAMHVVDDANKKALDIINTTEVYNEASKNELQTSLDSITKAEKEQLSHVGNELLASYKQAISNVKTESNQVMQNVSKEIEKQAASELSTFTTTLRQESADYHKQMQSKLESAYNEAQKDAVLYKQMQMKKAEDEVIELIRFITESAIGKGLTLQQHQNLVLDALEEAKAQGVIR